MSLPSPGSGDPRITSMLAHMAAFRQAEVGETTLDLYAAQLTADGYHLSDIETACHWHGQSERKEGETAFPSIGQLKRLIETVRAERTARAHAEAEARFKALPAPEIDPDRAKVWLDRIKFTARYGGTFEDAAARFPMPHEASE